MKIWLAIIAACSLLSCSADPDRVRQYRFDNDITIITREFGSGGALGQTTYQLSYRYDGKETKFFEGVNPKAFSIEKSNDAVSVKFCDGSVSLAEPIFIGPPNERLVHLELDLACST